MTEQEKVILTTACNTFVVLLGIASGIGIVTLLGLASFAYQAKMQWPTIRTMVRRFCKMQDEFKPNYSGGGQVFFATGDFIPRNIGTGNRAFDKYRADTLARLDDEQKKFYQFREKLLEAKDMAEFEQFMADLKK